MRLLPLGFLALSLCAGPARAETASPLLEPAAAAVVQRRWPRSLGLVEKRLAEKPADAAKTRPAVAAALKAGAAFAESEGADAQAGPAKDFRAALDSMGAAKARFLGRQGGLGEIARAVLGDAAFVALLDDARQAGEETPDTPSIRAEALYQTGRFAEAAKQARAALGINPQDTQAYALLKLAEGRLGPSGDEAGSGALPAGGSSRVARRVDPAAPAASLPASFRAAAAAPPALGATALDPGDPGSWDKQLLAPLLKHSDDNPVARAYLSPLINEHKVTIRLDREKDNADVKGNWGYYDLHTSVIHYNLDSINADIRQYDAFYAKDPARHVRPISSTRPLDAAQIEYVTGRFLPLAVHEAGGHGTHSEDLKRLLGAISAPLNKDTEVMAWRLEAAAIAAERRRDPRYLTEPTDWSKEENDWLGTWEESRRKGKPDMVVQYLDGMDTYQNLVHIGDDPAKMREWYSESIALVQGNCRLRYGAGCGAAITRLATLFPPQADADYEADRRYLDAHPHDDARRAAVMAELMKQAVAVDRLDPKGIAVVSSYYHDQEKRVSDLEGQADPLTLWQKLRSAWRE
jgi:tetratricopeptide (TPR) repeat protein